MMGEGPCWNGLGLLWPSGVAGEVLGRPRDSGWMAPGRVDELLSLGVELEVKWMLAGCRLGE